jgi:hypothetical protein
VQKTKGGGAKEEENASYRNPTCYVGVAPLFPLVLLLYLCGHVSVPDPIPASFVDIWVGAALYTV